jgi:hypothetical protein
MTAAQPLGDLRKAAIRSKPGLLLNESRKRWHNQRCAKEPHTPTTALPVLYFACTVLQLTHAVVQPSKYLQAIGMQTLGELEESQQNLQQNSRAQAAAQSRRKAAANAVARGHEHGVVVPTGARSARRSSAASASPRDDDLLELHPDMTLTAAGLRRLSAASVPDTEHSLPVRRNSDIPDVLRNLPGALAIASGTHVHGVRVSSAPSAVEERRRSVQHAVALAQQDPAVAERRRSSIALGAELAAMLGSSEATAEQE